MLFKYAIKRLPVSASERFVFVTMILILSSFNMSKEYCIYYFNCISFSINIFK